jgi:hypothetical protein
MTARDGFPRDMDRFALDAGTAERLVAGAVGVADAPPAYRGVARTLQALREAPDGPELFGEPAAVERIAAAVVLERPSRRVRRSRRTSLRAIRFATAAVVSCGLFLAGGLASVGALPEPAQNAASTVLGKVGISVPTGGDDPAVDAPPTTTSGPVPPHTTSPGQSSPGPAGPDVTAPPPDASNPTPPGTGQGGDDGAPPRGNLPEAPKGQEKTDSPKGSPEGAGGDGHRQ